MAFTFAALFPVPIRKRRPPATADEGNKIARLASVLVHMVFDCLNRFGKPERIVLAFPCLDQRHQHIEAVALRRAAFTSVSSERRASLRQKPAHPLQSPWSDLVAALLLL
jgi:hypothetical protein